MGVKVTAVLTDGSQKLVHLGVGGNLRGVHFGNSGITDLRGLDLSNADLRDANLVGVLMRGTKLDNALYTALDLKGANFA